MFRFLWRLFVLGCIMVTTLVAISFLVEAEDGSKWGKYNNKINVRDYNENVFSVKGHLVYCMWRGESISCIALH